jgi:hypothetical protein
MPRKKNARDPGNRKRAGQVSKHSKPKIAKPAPDPDDPRRCQARLRKDPSKRCSRWAQPGRDYCTSHQRGGKPPKHGLDSKYRVGLFEDLIAKFDDVPLDKVKDLTAEVVLLRGLLAGLAATIGGDTPEEQQAALWSASPGLRDLVDTIGKTAERMERIEHGLTVNLNARQVSALAGQVVAIINQEIEDPAVRQKISERIANLVVIA